MNRLAETEFHFKLTQNQRKLLAVQVYRIRTKKVS
jgi:hypothetical protein